MKGLALLGVVLVVLGLLSFVVPVPHSEDHGVKVGDAKIGIETHSSEKLPQLWVSSWWPAASFHLSPDRVRDEG